MNFEPWSRSITLTSPTCCRRSPLDAKRDALIEYAHSIGLVTRIAKNIGARLPPCFDLDDLIGPGNIGLVEAGHRFRFKRQRGQRKDVRERFVAWARIWIDSAIKMSIRRHAWTESRHLHIADMDDFDVPDHRQLPEAACLDREVREEIDYALGLLPARTSNVIQMHYRGGNHLYQLSRDGDFDASKVHRQGIATMKTPRLLRLVEKKAA